MEVDTGSPWSLVSYKTFTEIGNPDELQPCNPRLTTYIGDRVPLIGEASVHVKYLSQQTKSLPLLVVQDEVSLMGREWIENFPSSLTNVLQSKQPDSPTLNVVDVNTDAQLKDILQAHDEVFNTSVLGKLAGYQAKVQPVEEQSLFYKAAPVPYLRKQRVDECLDDMLEKGVIEPVKFSDYACPIVVADKADGNVRICGNYMYKLTANKVLRLEQYPLHTLEDLMQDLQGGQRFSKVDLSHAYHQIELEEAARKYTTVNTHRGLFQYVRLPFGLASAIFQRTIESFLADIPMCRPYLDDIIISGRNDAEHLTNVNAVLQRLQENGIKLK